MLQKLSENVKIVLLTKTIKFTNQSKGHYSTLLYFSYWKGIDNKNFLLFALPVILMLAEDSNNKPLFSNEFVQRWSDMANYYEILNTKDPNCTPTIEKIWKVNNEIIEWVKNTKEITKKGVNPKDHALSHSGSQILKYGLNWNVSSASFESAIQKDKYSARDTKVNALPAVINYHKFLFSLNLFSHLPQNIFNFFQIPLSIQEFLLKYPVVQQEKIPKSKYSMVAINGQLKYSYSFIYHDTLKTVLTIDSYSSNKSKSNQFVSLEWENKKVYAKIICICSKLKTIFFQQAKIIDKKKMEQITCKRTKKVVFQENIKQTSWNSLIEQVTCFEINSYFYITRIRK